MKRLTAPMIMIVLAFGLVGKAATTESTARQAITMRILPSTRLALTKGNNVSITLPSVATTGEALPSAQTDPLISLCWNSFVPTGHISKITAQLSTACTSGIAYKAILAKPTRSSGTSVGWQTLSADATDMLTNIGTENCSGAIIDYLAEAHKSPTSEAITVIWTITDVGMSN